MDPNTMVPHPFPAKGTRKEVKLSYREFLIEQAKAAGSKKKPVPIGKIKKTKPVSKKKPNAPTKKLAREIKIETEQAESQSAIRDWDGKDAEKPPKGWIEIKIKMEQGDRFHKLGQLREKGIRVKTRCYSMGYFVYWVPKEHKV